MHRTLKQETAKPPAFTLREQQARFDEFRECYNERRPHESLGFATPHSVYVASARTYPLILRDPEYGDRFVLRRVHKDGDIKMHRKSIFISESLRRETVGLLQTQDDRYELYFGDVLLGEVDTYWKTFTRVR